MNHSLRDDVRSDAALLWRCERLGGLELIEACYSTFSFSKHFHTTFVVELIERGTDEFICGQRHFRGQRGDIVVINPHDVHTGCSVGGGSLTYRALYPTQGFLEQICDIKLADRNARLTFPRRVFRDSRVGSRLMTALQLIKERPTDPRACAQLCSALRLLVQRHGKWEGPQDSKKRGRSSLDRTRSYLIDRIAVPVILDELADVAELSPYHLNRRFRERFGLPPHQYQINLRVERARALLRKGCSVVAVASECGFSDQAHLTRCFRRHIGTTPSRYANSKIVQEWSAKSV